MAGRIDEEKEDMQGEENVESECKWRGRPAQQTELLMHNGPSSKATLSNGDLSHTSGANSRTDLERDAAATLDAGMEARPIGRPLTASSTSAQLASSEGEASQDMAPTVPRTMSRNLEATSEPTIARQSDDEPSPWYTRLLFLRRIRRNFSTAYHTSPSFTLLFLASLIFSLLQILATGGVLVATADCAKACQQPLYFFLCAVVLLTTLSLPLQYLEARANIEALRLVRAASAELGPRDASLVGVLMTRHQHDEYLSYASPRFFRRKERIDRLNRLVELQLLLLLLFGNFWVFPAAGTVCVTACPLLYHCSLAWVIYGYVLVLTPLLLVLGVFCCLPLVLLVNRAIHGQGYGQGGVARGGQALWIDWLLLFHPPVQGLHRQPAAGVVDSGPVMQGLASHQIAALPEYVYQQQQQQQPGVSSLPSTMVVEECAICLAPFLDLEPVRKLPCRHIFHKECIGTWLRSSHTCPLCLHNLAAAMTSSHGHGQV